MFKLCTAALSEIAKVWKQLKYPPIENCLNKLYIYRMQPQEMLATDKNDFQDMDFQARPRKWV